MRLSLIMLCFSFALIACRYDSEFDEWGFNGRGNYFRDGKMREGKLVVSLVKSFCPPDTDSCLALIIRDYHAPDVPKSDITIGSFSPKLGRVELSYFPDISGRGPNMFYLSEFTTEGDVGAGLYSLSSQSLENFLEITELNMESGFISGRFAATVAMDSSLLSLGYDPDTIRITDGAFSGKINWKK
jgi:hypothetical protein